MRRYKVAQRYLPLLLVIIVVCHASVVALAAPTWLAPAAFVFGPVIEPPSGILTVGPFSLVNLSDGFKLTDADFTFTALVAGTYSLQWGIERPFTLFGIPEPWQNTSTLSGTVSYSGLSVNSIKLRTITPEGDVDLGTATVLTPTSNVPFSATYTGPAYTQHFDERLIQFFDLNFTTTAAGSFMLTLPDSADSRDALATVPEPSGLVLGSVGLGLLGGLLRRRI